MKKHTSEEAYYERIRNLASVNKTSIKESQNRTLGTLIDFKRAADGVAYGIIKENHQYYIKKGGMKQDPNVTDFAYIGGLANITDFQYKSLSEADKQRNMLFHTINEAIESKPSKTGSKRRLNEDKAAEEIEASSEMAAGLDAANDKTSVAPELAMSGAEPEGEMPPPMPAEEPAPEGDVPAELPSEEPTEEPAPEGGEELPTEEPAEEPAPEGGEEEQGGAVAPEGEEEEEALSDIQSKVGKLANEIKNSDLEKGELTWLLKTFVKGFVPNKDETDNPKANKMAEIDDDDRHEVSDLILKVVSPEAIQDLGQNVEDTAGEEEVAEQQCAECGGFAQFAESRGYNAQTIQECGDEEMTSLVSGYANAHNDGQNDGDFKAVAIFITPEIIEKLKGDYGHDEYAEKLSPYANNMNEVSAEDKAAQINELFGGLKNLGKAAGGAIGGALKGAGGAIKGAAQSTYNAVGDAASSVKTGVQNAAQNIKQTYNAGEINPEVKKLEGVAADLGKQIAALNKRMVGAGQQPVNVKSILATIQNQLGAGGQANLNKFRTAEGVVDPANIEVQPLQEEEKPEEEIDVDALDVDDVAPESTEDTEEKPEIGFAPASQSLGVGVVKPSGAPTTIRIEPDKSLEITINESERKLRQYVRNRLEEHAGIRKPSINENKKSDTLKKLDAVIDKQFKLYESVARKKMK